MTWHPSLLKEVEALASAYDDENQETEQRAYIMQLTVTICSRHHQPYHQPQARITTEY